MNVAELVGANNELEDVLVSTNDIFSNFHGLSAEQLANDDTQDLLIQSCADNPDFFGRDISKCLRKLSPYLEFPKEYEHGLTEVIIEANRLDKHSYFPTVIKEPSGMTKTILAYGERTSTIPDNAVKKEIINEKGQRQIILQYKFHHNHYISLLRKAVKAHPYLFKYGYELMGMLLSWKATFDKNQGPRGSYLSDAQKEIVYQKQRKNMHRYYFAFVKIKIAEAWEKGESASEWINKPLRKGISRNARILAQTLEMPVLDSIGGNTATVMSSLSPTSKKPQKKKFDATKLPSLFHKTGDGELDTMLDSGRERVEDPKSANYTLKSGQILLRKHFPNKDDDRPKKFYHYHVMTPRYLQKHFPTDNSLTN